MNFPHFWARASRGDFICWRWSSQTLAEAQALAEQAVEQLAARIKVGEYPPKHGNYYPDRPIREQILQEHKNSAGELAAVITRNSYGCHVLNTARVMFVDIDLPETKPPGLFQRLFGRKPSVPPVTPEAALARVENWTRQHPEAGWRIYRTRAGLRLLATHALAEPDSEKTLGILEALGSDPLYTKLCKNQKCFRARLTPKPWRCGINRRPERWPHINVKSETRFTKWEAQYQSFSAHWATCEFIRHTGNLSIHPEVHPIIQLHDEATRATSKLPLA